MKTLNYTSVLLLFILALTIASCGKKDDEGSPNTSMLTAGTWTGSAVYVGSQDYTEDFKTMSGYDVKEGTMKFETNGTYVETYKGQASPAGTWEFTNDERNILFDKDTDDEQTVLISKLDSDELFLTESGVELRFVR